MAEIPGLWWCGRAGTPQLSCPTFCAKRHSFGTHVPCHRWSILGMKTWYCLAAEGNCRCKIHDAPEKSTDCYNCRIENVCNKRRVWRHLHFSPTAALALVDHPARPRRPEKKFHVCCFSPGCNLDAVTALAGAMISNRRPRVSMSWTLWAVDLCDKEYIK